MHRFLGVLSVLFTGLHLTGLLLDDYVQLSLRDLLVPLASSWRPMPVALGVVAGYFLLAVLPLRCWPPGFRRWWKRVHLTSYLLFCPPPCISSPPAPTRGTPPCESSWPVRCSRWCCSPCGGAVGT